MRIKELDGLRFFAIFSVFLVHYRQAHVLHFMSLGWTGVDLFFAISGFLITGILIRLRSEPHPFKTFYWRRLLRIFPPYYSAFVVILLLAFAHGEVISWLEGFESATFLSSLNLGHSFSTIWGRLTGHLAFGSMATAMVIPWFRFFSSGLGVFWSLSVEEAFYLLWAPVLLKGSRRTILLFSLVPLFVCPMLRALMHTSSYPELFNFFCRFDSLAAGGCVALAFAAIERGQISATAVKWTLLTAIPAAAAMLAVLIWRCGFFHGIDVRSTMAFGVFGYTLLAIFFSAVVGACAQWAGSIATAALRLRPLTYLGQISYSMYLIHIPAYVAMGIALRWCAASNALLQAVLAIVCTMAVSALSWKYFESPILRQRDKLLAAHAQPR